MLLPVPSDITPPPSYLPRFWVRVQVTARYTGQLDTGLLVTAATLVLQAGAQQVASEEVTEFFEDRQRDAGLKEVLRALEVVLRQAILDRQIFTPVGQGFYCKPTSSIGNGAQVSPALGAQHTGCFLRNRSCVLLI